MTAHNARVNLKTLAPIFRRHKVRFAYLWGSRAEARERADSDYDIAVSVAGRCDDVKLWFDLVMALESDVDLVLLEATDLVVRDAVQSKGRLIWERDRTARIEFECRTRKEAWDEAPRWAVQDEFLARRIREGTFGR